MAYLELHHLGYVPENRKMQPLVYASIMRDQIKWVVSVLKHFELFEIFTHMFVNKAKVKASEGIK